MTENKFITEDKDKQATSEAPSVKYADIDSPRPTEAKMEGFFNRHTSGYWAVMIPALSARYLPEAVMKLGIARGKQIRNLTGKSLDALSEKLDTAYGLATGALMMAVTTFYMRRTYHDIKNVFAESIAYETGKKPEDVGIRDIMNSDNTLVQAAKRNFIKYNSRRYAVNLPFFGKHAIKGLSGDASVGLGVAANSVYLVNDVFHRKETFFERLQGFIENKIQHSDHLGDKITAIDLINLYELHSRAHDKQNAFSGRMDTQEWADRVKIFGRMADLMNETYGNEPNKEHANFTLSKMIYLMGHGMIGSAHPERSCTYIEVANRYGIEAVKDMASKNMADGSDIKYAKEKYPTAPLAASQAPCDKPAEQPQAGFAAKFAQDAAMNNAEKITTQRATANEAAFIQSA